MGYHKKYAKLDSGSIITYDACHFASDKHHYKLNIWKVIGTGRIHILDGVVQTGTNRYIFFKKVK